MEEKGRPYVVDRIDAEPFEPFIVDGAATGEIRWLRPGNGAPLGRPRGRDLAIGPRHLRLPLRRRRDLPPGGGAVRIELPDRGETIELKAGDVAYFPKGTRSVWTITEGFRKFVVTPPS